MVAICMIFIVWREFKHRMDFDHVATFRVQAKLLVIQNIFGLVT